MTEQTAQAARPHLEAERKRLERVLAGLAAAREAMGGDPAGRVTPRDVSLAVTAVEDALLRLTHGTPR